MSDTPRTDALHSKLILLADGFKDGSETQTAMQAAANMLDTLERELAEAIADKHRMDWLQLHREDLDVCRDLRRDWETIYVQCNVTGVLAYGDTLRAAVDAAKKTEGA